MTSHSFVSKMLPSRLKGAAKRSPHRSLVIVIGLSLVACLPLLINGEMINTRAAGDSPFLLVRLYELVLNLRHGVFPARWMPDGAYGLGYPFFNFYASLPYYLAALLYFLGFGYIWAIKLTQVLGFTLSATFMYLYTKRLSAGESAAMLAAIAYTYAPFHLTNVYVRGDSLAEFYAFAFYPMILWTFSRLVESPSPKELALASLSYAGLILAHNISALIFSPFIGFYVLLTIVAHPHGRLRRLLFSLLAGLVGLSLSAWFWLPALCEREFANLANATTGYFHYSNHFRGLNLVQLQPIFRYEVTSTSTPFTMASIQAILTAAGIGTMLFGAARRRSLPFSQVSLFGILVISTYLITPLSRSVWDRLPLLPYVQFPWRFLSVQAFAASFFIGHIPKGLTKLIPRPFAVGGLAFLLIAISMIGLHPEYLHIEESNVTQKELMLYEYFTANIGSTVRYEYLPRWVEPRPFISEALLRGGDKPPPLVTEGSLSEAKLVERSPTEERWEITVTSPQAVLAFQIYYFSGWRAYVDGQPSRSAPISGLGYIGLHLLQGEHNIILRLERTPMRTLAEGLSLVSLLSIFALFLAQRKLCWRPLAKWIGIGALSLLVLASLLKVGRAAGHEPYLLDLSMDERCPYLHHNPSGIRFGKAARLTGYTLSREELSAGKSLEITLHWDDVEREDLEVGVRLLSLAEHLFHQPIIIASASSPLLGETTLHHLEIPPETNRGLYLIDVRVRGGEGEMEPMTERGQALGSIYLKPVLIQGPQSKAFRGSILKHFGRGISLLSAEASQQVPDRLELALTWRAEQIIPANYLTSLRLREPSGHLIAQLDGQPAYGLYPTSLWLPGEQVFDRRLLKLPLGTPPRKGYSLEVIVYEAETLRPLDKTEIRDLSLTVPTLVESSPTLIQFNGKIAIAEVRLPQKQLKQGERLPIEVKWWAKAKPQADYHAIMQLERPPGTPIWSEERPLVEAYPSSLWPAKALVNTHYELLIGKEVAPGDYTLSLTLTDPETGRSHGRFQYPSSITVTRQERSYTIPPMGRELGVDFGQKMRLLGYDFLREGKELRITLHWQALREMTRDYTVFVHLFEPETERIAAQRDAMPLEGGYPTFRWQEGEVVSDPLSLSLAGIPPGSYRLAIGVYDSQTMVRLSPTSAKVLTFSNNRLILDELIGVD